MNDWAAIFDWDGVIVDSAAAHEASWERLAREEHRALPADHFQRGFGMKNELIIPQLLGWTHTPTDIRRLSLRKEALYRELIKEQGIAALPGVANWLERLRAAGIPTIIASSTHRLNITCTLDVIGLTGCFRDIVSAEDVSHGKPDPEVFLTAAQRLGFPPARSVVFEDAHVGIEAARRAGMKVVAVAGTHPGESLIKADRVVHRLDELTAAEVTTLVERGKP